MSDFDTLLSTPASAPSPAAHAPDPAPAPAPRRRRAWPWIVGGIAVVLLAALGVVLLFFRLPVYRMLVGDRAYVATIEKENVSTVLHTAAGSYVKAVNAARLALTLPPTGGAAALAPDLHAKGRFTLSADAGLLASAGLDGTGASVLSDALSRLSVAFESQSRDTGAARTDLSVVLGATTLLDGSVFRAADGPLYVSLPDGFAKYLRLDPAALASSFGGAAVPAGAASLPTADLSRVVKHLEVDADALAKALDAYAALYADALAKGEVTALGPTTLDVPAGIASDATVPVPCDVFQVALTGAQVSEMLQAILMHGADDDVLYAQTVGAVSNALKAAADEVAAGGGDAATLLALRAKLPTVDAWSAALEEAAAKAASEADLPSMTQTLSVGRDGRVLRRALDVVPTSGAGAGLVLESIPLPGGSGTWTRFQVLGNGGVIADFHDLHVSKGTASQDEGGLIAELAVTGSGTGAVQLAWSASNDTASRVTDLTVTVSAIRPITEGELSIPSDVSVEFALHNEGLALDAGTTVLSLAAVLPAGRAKAELTLDRLAPSAFDVPAPEAGQVIDLSTVDSTDPSDPALAELQQGAAVLMQTLILGVQKEAPDAYAWLMGLFP